MPNRYMADLSSNNGRFDPDVYHAAGHRVIGLKATEGVGDTDPTYRERVAGAHRAGLHVVHYHFARPDNHPSIDAEAHAFWTEAGKHWRAGDRVALDLEVEARLPRASWNVKLRRWRELALAAGHRHTWLYTYTAFFHEHLAGCDLGDMRLWLADYEPLRRRPIGLPRLWAHQFTDGRLGPMPHSCAGIGRCDVSRLSVRAYSSMLK